MKFKIMIFALGILLLTTINSSKSQSLFQKDNLNFEKGSPGSDPVSWVLPSQLKKYGYTALLNDSNAFEGKYCVVMTNPHNSKFKPNENDANISTMYQSIDAIPYRLKKVKFKTAAKIIQLTPETKGELFIIARQTKDSIVVNFVNEIDPIISNDWQYYEITVDIPANANELRYGFLLKSGGFLFLDDISIEIIQPENSIIEGPKKLNENNISNLNSFAKIYGYLKYFSPSDEARNMDWDRFLLKGISETENTEKDKLKNKLNELISPFQKFTIIADKTSNPSIYNKPINTFNNIAYSMSYSGGPIDRYTELFNSYRANIFATTRDREASIIQKVDFSKMDNKEIRINCDIKVDKLSPGSNAQLWMRVDMENSSDIVSKTTAENPVNENQWAHRTLTAKLPNNVKSMDIALVFLGEGSAWFDNITIEIFDGRKKIKDIEVLNHSFESTGTMNNINNWQIDPAVINAGYTFNIDEKNAFNGKKSLRIDSDKESLIKYAEIGKSYSFNIGNDLKLNFPLIMFTDSIHTLPSSDFSDFIKINGKPEQFQPVPQDRLSRIAAVIQLWNVIKHFSINNISEKVLDSALNSSIKSASENDDLNKFNETIKSLLYITNDSRYRVWNIFSPLDYSLPLVFKKIEDKIVLTVVIDSAMKIKPGDEIIKINDIDINYIIDSVSRFNPSLNKDYKIEKALAEIRAGEKDSKVKLTIKNMEGKIFDEIVKRNELLNNIFDLRPPVIAKLDTDIVYIDMTEMTDSQFKDYFEALKGTKAFIFDLRGSAIMSEHVLGLFTKSPLTSVNWEIPIYTFPDRENQSVKKIKGSIQSRGRFSGAKLYLLINERTSGYSESIAQIAKQNKIGKLIGSSTSGNASEVIPFRIITGLGISLSAMKCYNDKNEMMFNLPITPDYKVDRTLKNTLLGKDDLVQKALQLIKE